MTQCSKVEEALEELRSGRIILVTDDADRENEGDFICAAEFATTANINFMATHGKGLICMPMSEEYVRRLQIPQMVTQSTDNHETAFTVSIDSVRTHHGDLRRGAVHNGPQVRGRARPAGGFPPPGPHVSAAGQKKRRAGTGRTHGGHGGSVPPGGNEGVRPLL